MDVTAAGTENISADDNASTIVVKDCNIIIKSSVENAQVNLFAINGAVINHTTIIDCNATFSNVTPGIYVVTVGCEAHKVVVK